ncbi:virulence-associated E family protein [Geminocystis herdmanii]|uniref:virulence-associated E family protein n=1 Tax=Geminocystis herdmanii TaxID=669359 RepID=UPI000346DDE6|nr:virulence-associated E family protein [Geminocystis herdmanii]
MYQLNDSQCDDLLSIIEYSNISNQKPKSTSSNTMNSYEKFLSELTLPINEEIPLEICLALKTRELLKGVGEGMRDDSGALIARDLIGTASYLNSIGQRYNQLPYDLLADFCQKCSPPLTINDCERIFNSAKKNSPKSSLDSEKIDNCIKAWYRNNNQEIKSLYQSKKESKTNNTLSDKTTDTVEKKTKVEKLDNIAETREILLNDYSSRLRFNELKRIVELDNEEAYLDDLYLKIHEDYGVKVSKQIAYDLAVMIAKKNSYHPVKDYLDNLETDNQEIDIKNLSSLFFGTTDKIYDEMIYRHLIGSVARVYKAGCKFDTALILQGSQGIRKSTFFKVLYGDEFFTDSVTGTDRDNLLIAHQNWCCELAEFETITNKKASGELKAFLSKSVDTFREPYARSSRMVKRQCVMVGSVNESEFLVDTTGNRRFWVIPVNTQIDTDKVIKYRDDIWYQAKKAFLEGEFWYLDEKYQKESEALNKEYLYQSTWDCQELDNYLQGFEEIGVSGKDILTTVLGFELKDINSSHERKLGHILRKKGWINKPKKQNGKTQRVWFCESGDILMNKSLNLSDPSDPFIERIYTNGYSRDRIKDQIDKCFLSDPLKKGSDQIKDQTDKLSDPTSNPYISTMDRMDRMDQIQTSPLENLDNSANIELNQDDSEKNQDNLNDSPNEDNKTKNGDDELTIWRKGLYKEFKSKNITDKEKILIYIRKGLDDNSVNSFNDLSINQCVILLNKLRGIENIFES